MEVLPELDPNQVEAQARFMSAVIEDMQDREPKALQEYAEAAKLLPADNDLALEVSGRLLASRKTEEALEVLARAAARPGVSGDVLGRLSVVQASLGHTNEALVTARRALSVLPSSTEAARALFLLLMREKRYTDAALALDQALAQTNLPAEHLVALFEMSMLLSQVASAHREPARTNALVALDRAMALHPGDPDLRNKVGDGYVLLGQPEKASQIYLDLLRQYPENEVVRTSVRAKLIDTYLRGKDRSQATEHLEQMVRDNPGNAQVYFILGGIAIEKRQWEKAVDRFGKAILFQPDLEPAYYDLALAQVNTDDPVAALRTLSKARDRFGENFSLEFMSGLAELVSSNYTAAIKYFTSAEVIARATDTNRLTETLYFQLGAAHERAGAFEKAGRYFELALEIAPDSAETMNYLGYMWAERGEHLDRAHTLLRQAVKLQPKNPAYLDSLAWVLHKQGKPAEALPFMTQAIELTEKPDPTLYDHLGDIQAALDQTDKARAAWQRALELDPKNQQIQRKLSGEAPADAPPAKTK